MQYGYQCQSCGWSYTWQTGPESLLEQEIAAHFTSGLHRRLVQLQEQGRVAVNEKLSPPRKTRQRLGSGSQLSAMLCN